MIDLLKQINDSDKICVIQQASKQYEQAIELRTEILRKPLGLHFTKEQLDEEAANYHIAYYRGEEMIAYLMLVPEGDKRMKMKQVAVAGYLQGKGIGAKIVLASEEFTKKKGFDIMYCHARDTAVPFYERLNYQKIGEMFLEVTIPHYHMEKSLI